MSANLFWIVSSLLSAFCTVNPASSNAAQNQKTLYRTESSLLREKLYLKRALALQEDATMSANAADEDVSDFPMMEEDELPPMICEIELETSNNTGNKTGELVNDESVILIVQQNVEGDCCNVVGSVDEQNLNALTGNFNEEGYYKVIGEVETAEVERNAALDQMLTALNECTNAIMKIQSAIAEKEEAMNVSEEEYIAITSEKNSLITQQCSIIAVNHRIIATEAEFVKEKNAIILENTSVLLVAIILVPSDNRNPILEKDIYDIYEYHQGEIPHFTELFSATKEVIESAKERNEFISKS